MINWTDEAMRAEADYRRQALHRMVAQRSAGSRLRGDGVWQRLLSRRRH